MNGPDPLHRGRMQAQGQAQPGVKVPGNKIEESEAWSNSQPPTASKMLALLDRLYQKLPPTEQRVREDGFRKMRQIILAGAAKGGIKAPYSKSWRNQKLRGGVRVDLEIQEGMACIPDPTV